MESHLPEKVRPASVPSLIGRVFPVESNLLVGATFNPVNTGFVPMRESESESYEEHIKHLNKANRFIYG